MAEYRKSAHGEIVQDLAAVIDAQIAGWGGIAAPTRGPRVKVPTIPERIIVETRRAGQLQYPELMGLFSPPPSQDDKLRAAFSAFLQHTDWTCERCGREVDNTTLNVPPPTVSDGVVKFHMYCSEHGSAA